MATTYEDEEERLPSRAEVVKAAISAPVREPRVRIAGLLAAVGAATALAPDAVAAAGVFGLVYAAFEIGRRWR